MRKLLIFLLLFSYFAVSKAQLKNLPIPYNSITQSWGLDTLLTKFLGDSVNYHTSKGSFYMDKPLSIQGKRVIVIETDPIFNASVAKHIKPQDTTRWAQGGGGTTYTGTAPIVVTGSVISVNSANASQSGVLSSTDWNTFNGKQNNLTLTTTGSSGTSTLTGSTLNIPQYSGGGSSLTAGINTLIQNNIINANTPLPASDTVYVLMSGQSNAGFPNNSTPVYDTLKNNNVQIWDWISNKWVVYVVGKRPSNTAGYTLSGNTAWYFGKKINEVTGKKVKIVLHYHTAMSINSWHTGTARGVDLDSLMYKASQSGVQKFNLFIWQQGESDNGNNSYMIKFDSIKATLRTRSYFPKETPIVVIGMPQAKWGATPGYQASEPNLQSVNGNSDPWDIYADTDSCIVQSTNQPHFNNQALKKLGSEKVYNAYNRLPYYDFKSYITPQYVWVTHKDSTSVSANYQAIKIQNTSSYGSTGILMKAYNGNDQFRFLCQNPNLTISPFTANQNIISSENGKDFAIYTATIQRMLIDNAGVVTIGSRLIINPSGASSSFIKFQTSGADVGLMGNDAVLGGSATDCMFYTYGANNFYLYTNGSKRLKIASTGAVQNQLGSSTSWGTIGSTFNPMYSDSSSVTTTETPLYRSTIPNSPFVTNGDFITYELEGTYAANTNTKTLNFYLAGNLLETITQTTPASTLYSFKVKIKIFRSSITVLRIFTDFQSDITGTSVVTNKLKTQDLTLGAPYLNQTLLINVTGTGTYTGDIIGKTGITRYK